MLSDNSVMFGHEIKTKRKQTLLVIEGKSHKHDEVKFLLQKHQLLKIFFPHYDVQEAYSLTEPVLNIFAFFFF